MSMSRVVFEMPFLPEALGLCAKTSIHLLRGPDNSRPLLGAYRARCLERHATTVGELRSEISVLIPSPAQDHDDAERLWNEAARLIGIAFRVCTASMNFGTRWTELCRSLQELSTHAEDLIMPRRCLDNLGLSNPLGTVHVRPNSAGLVALQHRLNQRADL